MRVFRLEGFMCHGWIFDVLSDLKAYAIKHDLPALAAKADEALVIAKAEIEAGRMGRAGSGGNGGTPPSGRAH